MPNDSENSTNKKPRKRRWRWIIFFAGLFYWLVCSDTAILLRNLEKIIPPGTKMEAAKSKMEEMDFECSLDYPKMIDKPMTTLSCYKWNPKVCNIYFPLENGAVENIHPDINCSPHILEDKNTHPHQPQKNTPPL